MNKILEQSTENIQRKHGVRTNTIFYDKKWEWGFLRVSGKTKFKFFHANLLLLNLTY